MNIQEISVSNNQRKKLSQMINDQNIIQLDDNGDVIVNVAAYLEHKSESRKSPIEDILENESLDYDVEFFVFS